MSGDRLLELLESLRRDHLIVDEDCWYSCPKSGSCCNEEAGSECDCGADAENAVLDEVIAEVRALVQAK